MSTIGKIHKYVGLKPVVLQAASPNNNSCKDCATLLQKVDEIKENYQAQNMAIMAALAEQKVLMTKIIRQESFNEPIIELFPILADDGLATVESKICPENRQIYISTISRLMQHSPKKYLKNIFDEKIIIAYNLDGTHGKKRLKSYTNFYAALLDAISRLPTSGEPEEQLRSAFRLHKKRYFKNTGASKK